MAATRAFTPPPSTVGPGPPVHGFAVTPSDTTLFDPPIRYLWVGATGGDVAVQLAGDTTAVTLTAVPAGTMLQLCAVRVMDTDTTAPDIVALY
jgi:hypothetical protein